MSVTGTKVTERPTVPAPRTSDVDARAVSAATTPTDPHEVFIIPFVIEEAWL